MGVIFLGQDDALGRKAAIKVLGPDRLSDPKAEARFKREATAVARLKHPNIAALYEMGEHDNKPYLAIEWVEGESLDQILKRGPLPVPRALAIIEQVLRTLDYAHAHGVVHRDIKPANLMISGDDHVTLVDFGLAFLLSEPGITSTGVLFGTPLYLAPEMAGEDGVDGRADLYSAALVFFEMVTGSPPFEPAPPAELISQHLHAPRPSVLEKKPDLPAALEPVLEKAMCADRDRRYRTGTEFLEALKAAAGPAPPPPPRPRVLPYVVAGLALLSLGLWAVSPVNTPAPPPSSPVRLANRSFPAPASQPSPMDWTQIGGDPAHNYQLYDELEKPDKLRWKASLPTAESVLVAGGKLIVAGPDFCEAREAETGKILWRDEPGGRPILYPDSELVLLQNGKLWRALAMQDGEEWWRREVVADGPGGVLAADEWLYAGVGDFVVAMDPSNAELVYATKVGGPVQAVPVARSLGAFVTTKTGVVAVDAFTRKIAWRWRAPAPPTAIVASSDDTLVVGCQNGHVSVLPMLTGGDPKKPHFETDIGVPVVGIALVGGATAVLGETGYLAWFNIPNGGESPMWTHQFSKPAGPPLTDGEQVVVATQDGQLISLKNGQVTWKMDLGGPCKTTPTPAGDWLYVLAGGNLSAYTP